MRIPVKTAIDFGVKAAGYRPDAHLSFWNLFGTS